MDCSGSLPSEGSGPYIKPEAQALIGQLPLCEDVHAMYGDALLRRTGTRRVGGARAPAVPVGCPPTCPAPQACLPACLRACLPACVPACLRACVRACVVLHCMPGRRCRSG